MSYANLFSMEVHRLALRDTVNEGGEQDAPATAATAPARATDAEGMAKAHAAGGGSSEQPELSDVVRLDPLKKSGDGPAPTSSQRVLLVTRPSQRCVD